MYSYVVVIIIKVLTLPLLSINCCPGNRPSTFSKNVCLMEIRLGEEREFTDDWKDDILNF